MKKYLYLQLKRAAKFFPFVLAVTLVLLFGTLVIFNSLVLTDQNKEENTMAILGISGDTDDSFLKMGLGALQAFDDTKYSIEIRNLEEDEAAAALKKGELSAYIVVPEKFMEKALRGELDPMRFVTTAHTGDVVTMLKNELLTVITNMVITSQQGTFGTEDMKTDNNISTGNNDMEAISLEYFGQILNRNDMLSVEELGVGDSLNLTDYYICSLLIFFVMLLGLPFAALYCKGDNTLTALLSAKGVSSLKILFAEYLSHLISLLAIVTVILGGAAIADKALGLGALPLGGCPFLYVLPTVILVAAFNIMIFELSGNLIGGMLLHFFASLSICYISGCFFPLYSFPEAVQSIAGYLPTTFARTHLSGYFLGGGNIEQSLPLFGFAALFFIVALIAKRLKLSRGGTA